MKAYLLAVFGILAVSGAVAGENSTDLKPLLPLPAATPDVVSLADTELFGKDISFAHQQSKTVGFACTRCHTFKSGNLNPLSPPPAATRKVVPLTNVEQLGKDLFFDHTLSNPAGYSCAICHDVKSGFTGPSALVNDIAGPVPGVIPGRFGFRKPQAVAYSAFSPVGPTYDTNLAVYIGGNFWDGRAPDNATQARMPFLNQNEMANTPATDTPYPPQAGGFSPLVVQKVQSRPYAGLFQEVYGAAVFQSNSVEQIYDLITAAIAAYEASLEINQFSSAYDAAFYTQPPRYKLTPQQESGRQLFFNQAQCFQCHSSEGLTNVMQATGGRDTFTMYCYANIGVPANTNNPFYGQTNCVTNPEGCNPLGADFVDFGLGMNPNPAPDGTLFYTNSPGDIQEVRGLFKAPSLRNAAEVPNKAFVKSFMHNGVFKSLAVVVDFYNKRNIAVDTNGVEVAFDLTVGPPPGFTPLFPPPEVLDNVQNSAGVPPASAGNAVANNGLVGNLGLTDQQEADLVSFLEILVDGHTKLKQ